MVGTRNLIHSKTVALSNHTAEEASLSRSIHTTRRHLRELKRADFADQRERQRRVDEARRMLQRKRIVKAQVWRRQVERQLPEAPVSIASIPIEVRDQQEFVHYPASVEDIVAVLDLLPPGTLDGVSRIVLCLGAEYQREMEEADEGIGDPDPLLGRLSVETLPGVYSGFVLGTYFADDASIWLYAYIYDAASLPDRGLRELYLRLKMLVTLLHEVAHHWDGSACDVRGRWADRPEGKSEYAADKHAHQWTQTLVIPYLERRYPSETRALVEWVGQQGGVTVPLSNLVDHPNETFFNTECAVGSLFKAYDRGLPPASARLNFAHELHFAERFHEALQGVAGIVTDNPDNLKARALQADIYEHLERYEQAEHAAKGILAEHPECIDGWQVLVHVYRAQGRWRDLEAAATRSILLCRANERQSALLLSERACARIELGDAAGAEADLEQLQLRGSGTRARPIVVDSLRALLLLRTGWYEEALRMAQSHLQRRRWLLPTWGILLAVRYEAAQRLGRPQEAGTISARAATLLRSFGHGQWLDRLVADYGLRIWSKRRI